VQQYLSSDEGIKNRLFRLEVEDVDNLEQDELTVCKELIEDIELFDRDYRKNHKPSKKFASEGEYKIYLKPPKPILIKRQNSNGSCCSEFSDDGSSFLSSGSCISSCSDLSEYESKSKNSANSTVRGSPSNSSANIKVECLEEEARN
jgi:hypothetical protein